MPAAVGVDGCPGGWIAVSEAPDGAMRAAIFDHFREITWAFPDAVIAIDMPIGLPNFSRGGRGPEGLMRPLLGQRQSSVFSIPSRAAVYAETEPFTTVESWYAAHRRASAVARATSNPSRSVSIQAFALFPKIREIDTLLVARPELRERVIESHPEVAFWRLNGRRPLTTPKKVKGQVNPAGMAERRALLTIAGFNADFLAAAPPRPAKADDFLDACAVLVTARHVAAGTALCFPDPPGRDRFGLPVTIRC